MNIKFKEFANIGSVDFSDDSDLTLLVGDNGVGKTFFLEAYTKINDYLLEHFTDSDFFEKCIETLDLNLKLAEKKHNMPIEKDHFILGVFNKENTFPIQSNYQFSLEINNIKKIEDKIEFEFQKLKEKLNKEIKEEIFFDNMDLKGLEVEFVSDLNSLKELRHYEFKLYSQKNVPNINTNEGNQTEKSVFLSMAELGSSEVHFKIIDKDEQAEIIEAMDKGDFSTVKQLISELLTQSIRKIILEKNNFKEIIYIPSERVISMSETVERMLKNTNFNDLRYSERKFMQIYTAHKDLLSIRSEKIQQSSSEFSDEFMELLGGNPIFNKNGELICIEDDTGKQIKRSMFSTKQNKLSSLFILESKAMSTSNKLRDIELQKVIIIEEPEAHLSLKGIFQIAEYIIQLTEDSKVIVSTHSDVFVSSVNNYYLKNKNKITIGGYEIINYGTTNVFKQLDKGDYGLSSEFINEQLNFLLNETKKIQNNDSSYDIGD